MSLHLPRQPTTNPTVPKPTSLITSQMFLTVTILLFTPSPPFPGTNGHSVDIKYSVRIHGRILMYPGQADKKLHMPPPAVCP